MGLKILRPRILRSAYFHKSENWWPALIQLVVEVWIRGAVVACSPAATPEILSFPASGTMPRSATREMACYALTMICSAAAASGACTSDDATWSEAVQVLSACAHVDINRFAMGFCAESLRRLAQNGRLHGAVSALEKFVASPRWKPPELAGHFRNIPQDKYDYGQGLFVVE